MKHTNDKWEDQKYLDILCILHFIEGGSEKPST